MVVKAVRDREMWGEFYGGAKKAGSHVIHAEEPAKLATKFNFSVMPCAFKGCLITMHL
jgi:hypothetical protein